MDQRGNSLSPPLPRDSDDDSMVSDCESGVSGGEVIVRADVRSLESVGGKFIDGLGPLASRIQVVSIRRNKFPTVISQARVDSFEIFARATAQLRHGNANVKHAWYGVSGMEEILEILQHGFGHDRHSRGLRLSPEDCPHLSVRRSVADKDGLRHLVLCRVILGKMEVVSPGSDQCRSISDEYDSGVDDVSSPKEYFIRSNRMNTHVLPEYVLSFKIPPTGRAVNVAAARETSRPRSPWVPFPALISALSKILPQHDMAIVLKLQKDYREMKISRQQMIQKLRVIAGDKLLFQVIKSFREKLQKPPASYNKVKEWQPESQQPTASCNKVEEWQPDSQQSGINNCPY